MPEVVVLDPSDAHKPIPSQLTPLGNGRYRVDYVAKEPGLHSVNVFFAGKPIPNSPFGVQVAPSIRNITRFFKFRYYASLYIKNKQRL